MLLIIGLLVFGAISLALLSLLRQNVSPIEARLDMIRRQSHTVDSTEGELSTPFSSRVLAPSLRGIGRVATSVLPTSILASVENQLLLAGNPLKVGTFATIWVALIAIMAFLGLAVGLASGSFGSQSLVILMVMLMLGYMGPRMWLRGRVNTRQKATQKQLPDALDLITTCVEAGLGLDAALARVAEKTEGPLGDELRQALREIAMGRLRRDALTEMGDRTGVEDLISFIAAVTQAEQLGVSIGQVLRVQSVQMRTRRRQRAEKAAHQAPVKMMIPLVFLVFPAFMIVVLGPAMIQIKDTL